MCIRDRTATLYADCGLFTCRKEIVNDLYNLFRTCLLYTSYFVVDFFHEFAGGLYGFFIALRCCGCDGLVVRHPNFVKLFQIGGVDGDEIDALV